MAGEVRVKEGDVNVSEMIQEMDSGAVVSYGAEYAQYVEFPTAYAGTQPPFDAIHAWVDRKWPDLSSGLKDAGQPAANRAEQKRNVAWIVVKAIAQNGTEGVHFGQRGLDAAAAAAPAIARQFEGSGDPNAPEKIVAEVAEVGFNKSQAIISQEATDTGNLLQSGSIALVDDPRQITSGGGGGGE
ncbi:hypothetical protein M201_gp36 [Haloarcula californiae tailed virus 2]|uniref:Uncharacterized protein n=1 Tax=Haloarcula californiae tailed virus 2 TaxID=1273747 RepID=R4TM59_9CAUD|nr:hypothetical protein M201_gp36 [Haloarcula californiae tailed virus 2]AGM11807.1 hypothetical protein HCTV2_36 [Haloarcula californiae tailed virus 2]